MNVSGVWSVQGDCYIIIGLSVSTEYDVDLDLGAKVGENCYVSECGYTPPPPTSTPIPTPTGEGPEEPF
jgi:hypothetical protein